MYNKISKIINISNSAVTNRKKFILINCIGIRFPTFLAILYPTNNSLFLILLKNNSQELVLVAVAAVAFKVADVNTGMYGTYWILNVYLI